MRVDAKKLTVLSVLAICVGVLLPASPATGTITTTGDVTPAYDGTSDPWNIAGDLKVGNTGAASLYIGSNTGSVLNDTDAYMAYQPGSTASALTVGSGALWHSSGGLYIGGSQTQAGGTAELRVNGGVVQANQVVIWGGGTLSGSGDGTLRTPSVTNWGTISPGVDTSISPLHIDGNLTFQPGSVLQVNVANFTEIHVAGVQGESSSPGISDQLLVTGNVDIVGGTVRVISTQTIVGAKQFTIIDANKVTGTFTTLDTALLHVAMVDPNERLGYTADKVLLRITADPFNLVIGGNDNQQAVGGSLQKIADLGGNSVTTSLQQLPTLDAVRAAYDQLSGQSRPPLAPIVATDTAKFMGIVSNRLQGARGSVAKDLSNLSDGPLLAMAEPDSGIGSTANTWDNFLWDLGPAAGQGPLSGWGTWGKVYGLFGDRKTENGVTGYSFDFLGQSAGVEVQFTDRFIGGVTGGHSNGQVDYDTLADTADIATTHAGLYSTYSGNGWYFNSLVMHSWFDLHTERVVDLTGERNEGYFDGREWSGYAEAGFDWQPATSWLVQPLTAFQFSRVHLDQYAETGYNSALLFEDQLYESYKASLGAKVTKELRLSADGLAAIVQARGRWVHEFGDVVSSVQARFLPVQPSWFTVSDEEIARDTVMLGVGAGIRLTRGLRAFVDYDMSFNADETVSVISGALDYRW